MAHFGQTMRFALNVFLYIGNKLTQWHLGNIVLASGNLFTHVGAVLISWTWTLIIETRETSFTYHMFFNQSIVFLFDHGLLPLGQVIRYRLVSFKLCWIYNKTTSCYVNVNDTLTVLIILWCPFYTFFYNLDWMFFPIVFPTLSLKILS